MLPEQACFELGPFVWNCDKQVMGLRCFSVFSISVFVGELSTEFLTGT